MKTHLRDMLIMPEMIGSVIGVYNGKTFNQVRHKGQPHSAALQSAAEPRAAAEVAAFFIVDACFTIESSIPEKMQGIYKIKF